MTAEPLITGREHHILHAFFSQPAPAYRDA